MSVSVIVFTFWTFVCVDYQIGFPSAELVKCVQSASKVRDLEYEIEVIPEGRTDFYERAKIKQILLTREYWELLESKFKSGEKIFSERSYIGDRVRSFNHKELDGSGKEIVSRGFGMIDTVEETSKHILLNSGDMLGFGVTRGLPIVVDLSRLILECKIVTGPGQLEYIIEDVFNWGDGDRDAVYDIGITLSSEHDFLPKRIVYYERNPESGRVIEGEREVVQFHRTNGLWIPTKFRSRSLVARDKSWSIKTINTKTLRVNQSLSAQDLEARFPPSKEYVDMTQPDKPHFLNGKRLEIVEPTNDERNFSIAWRSNWFVAGAVILGVGAALVLLWKRNRNTLMLVLSFMWISSLGCRNTGDDGYLITSMPSDTKTSDLSFQPGLNQSISVRVGELPQAVRFHFINESTHEVALDSNVGTTCGCTTTSLSKTLLNPGEGAVLDAVVTIPSAPQVKTLQVTLKQLSPEYKEYPLTIEANFFGDWFLSKDRIQFNGAAGQSVQESFFLKGNSNIIRQATANFLDSGIKVLEDRMKDGGRILVVEHVCSGSPGVNVLSDVRIKNPDAVPDELVIRFSEKVRSPGKWALPVVSGEIGQEVSCVLILEDNARFVELSGSPIGSVEPLVNGNELTFAFTIPNSGEKVMKIDAIIEANDAQSRTSMFVAVDREKK